MMKFKKKKMNYLMLSKKVHPFLHFRELPNEVPQTHGKKVYRTRKKYVQVIKYIQHIQINCKYLPNVKSVKIFILTLTFISLSVNKEIGNK